MATPKKSIMELKANGSYRPSRHGQLADRPTPKVEAPSMPSFLSGEAEEYFKLITQYGLQTNTIGKPDGLLIGFLANELVEWEQLDRESRREGLLRMMPTATGFLQRVVNPKVKLRDSKLKIILRMLGELGMSPASRSRVHVNEKHERESSELGMFLAAIKQKS